jgi:putative endonuclease
VIPGRMGQVWFCYVVECADGTLYAGITTELERRLALHNRGVASRYTRGRRPVRLVHAERYPDRAAASRREHEIKSLPRLSKRRLLGGARKARRPVSSVEDDPHG